MQGERAKRGIIYSREQMFESNYKVLKQVSGVRNQVSGVRLVETILKICCIYISGKALNYSKELKQARVMGFVKIPNIRRRLQCLAGWLKPQSRL